MRSIVVSDGSLYLVRNIRCRERDGTWECVVNLPPALVELVFGELKKHLPALITVEENKIVIRPAGKQSQKHVE